MKAERRPLEGKPYIPKNWSGKMYAGQKRLGIVQGRREKRKEEGREKEEGRRRKERGKERRSGKGKRRKERGRKKEKRQRKKRKERGKERPTIKSQVEK